MASTFHFSIAASNLVKILSSFTNNAPTHLFYNTLTITDSSAPSNGAEKRNSLFLNKRDSLIMTADFQPLTFTPIEFSLTAGTQIPAPPDSPPMTPTKTGLPPLEEESNDENQNPNGPTARNGNISTPDSKLGIPLSPLSASSAGSQGPKRTTGIRKFLSLRSLRGESRRHRRELSPNGTTVAYTPHSSSRPGSPYTTETALSADASHSRKNASWFASVSGRRKSQMYVIGRLDERIANSTSPEVLKLKGPPPPAIPEFSLGNELEMGGDDLFKNIK
jgi:hypothetical protein